jgi:hypothetical protein
MRWLSLVGGPSAGDSAARRRTPRRRTRPRLDALESRELKDGGISLISGTIEIGGTDGTNSVVVSYTDPSHGTLAVTWNGTTATFDRAAVTGIDFEGQDGFFDSFCNLTDVSSAARGGDGLNVFYGGTGANTLVGGDGVNIFWGNGAFDTLAGGDGTNIFYGVGGDDTVSVGRGFNLIVRA